MDDNLGVFKRKTQTDLQTKTEICIEKESRHHIAATKNSNRVVVAILFCVDYIRPSGKEIM